MTTKAERMNARALPLILASFLVGSSCSGADEPTVSSADEASELVTNFIADQAAYFSDGIAGDGASVEDLRTAVSEHWVDGANIDSGAAHDCYVELFDQLRPFVDAGGVFESSVEAVNVIDLDGELWVVQYDVVQFITGVGEIADAGATFVGPDGIIGGRLDESGDPGCLDRNSTPDEDVQALVARGVAADR